MTKKRKRRKGRCARCGDRFWLQAVTDSSHSMQRTWASTQNLRLCGGHVCLRETDGMLCLTGGGS